MKKILALLFVSLFTITTYAQERKIKANGVVQEKNRRVQPYTKVVIEGEVLVEILNNPFKNTIRTTGDGNVHQLIQATSADGVLTIKRRSGFVIDNPTVPLKVSLTSQDIAEITMVGNGGVLTNMGAIQVPKLTLTNTGQGKMDLRVRVEELLLNTENNGEITVEGNANTVRINSKGSGDIVMNELSNFYTEVNSTGSGNIYTNTVNGIDGSLNGTGNLHYRFTKTVNVTENGEGKAIKE